VVFSLTFELIFGLLRKKGGDNESESFPENYELSWTEDFPTEHSLSSNWIVESKQNPLILLEKGLQMGNNVQIVNGTMRLIAESINDLNYSARITSNKNFTLTLGKVEALIKMPYGPGIFAYFALTMKNIGTTNSYINIFVMADYAQYDMAFSSIDYGRNDVSYDQNDVHTQQLAMKHKYNLFGIKLLEDRVGFQVNGEEVYNRTRAQLPEGISEWPFGKNEFYVDFGIHLWQSTLQAVKNNFKAALVDRTTEIPSIMDIEYVKGYKLIKNK